MRRSVARANCDLHRLAIAPDGEIHVVARLDASEATRTLRRQNRLTIDVRDQVAATQYTI
jgi:hypothetical protein